MPLLLPPHFNPNKCLVNPPVARQKLFWPPDPRSRNRETTPYPIAMSLTLLRNPGKPQPPIHLSPPGHCPFTFDNKQWQPLLPYSTSPHYPFPMQITHRIISSPFPFPGVWELLLFFFSSYVFFFPLSGLFSEVLSFHFFFFFIDRSLLPFSPMIYVLFLSPWCLYSVIGCFLCGELLLPFLGVIA